MLGLKLRRFSDFAKPNHQVRGSSAAQINHQSMRRAIRDLAASLEPQDVTFSDEVPLLAAMGAIAHIMSVKLHLPSAEILNQAPDPIDAIAHTSHLRIHRVRLTHHWWRNVSTPLLAFIESDDRPVALLPTPQGYCLFDPTTQTRTFINTAVATILKQDAYSFYRALPTVVNHALQLLRFGVQGYEADVIKVVGLGTIATLLGMVPLQLTAILINDVIPNGDRTFLVQIGLLLLTAAVVQIIFQITQSILTLRIESTTDNVLQSAIWDRLLKLSPTFFRHYTSGDLVNRVLSVRDIHQRLSGATQRSLLSGTFAVLNLGLMVVYSQQLAFVGVGIGLLMAVITAAFSIAAIDQARTQQQINGENNGLTVQLVNGITKLRVAMAEERAFAAWAKQYSQQLKLKASLQQINDQVSTINEILPLVSALLMFGLAVPLVQNAQLTLGTFLAFNFAFATFIKGVTDLSNTITDLVDIVPIWERIQPILQAPLEPAANNTHPGQLTGRLVLENISFRYSEHGSLVLKDISLHAEPGEFVAIVGPSGSGKSTILRLLLGFETPTAGRVVYDDKDLAGLDLQALRRMLGVVLQNGQINTGSIFENITAGALVPLADAWEAARMAGFADDIEKMPMGMHTLINEGGTNLSGGQRQRLLIARALVSKPKVLLLDEATSALDNQTQAIVAKNLETLKVTRIVIAHRLSTIRNADRIYVINAGRVEQAGSFSELMREEGLFAQLAARQLETPSTTIQDVA
jgi:NHLM bacteriocin system ABC transporter ATP-binding protein